MPALLCLTAALLLQTTQVGHSHDFAGALGATRARIGLDDWPGGAGERARTYYRMNTASVRGAVVSGANLYVKHSWAASCNNTAAVVFATGTVSKWNANGLAWGREPAKKTGVIATANGGRQNCGKSSEKVSPPELNFDVKGYAASAIGEQKLSSLTFRVEAKDMDDKYSWKQLWYGGGATLRIKYAFKPYLTGVPSLTPSTTDQGRTLTTTRTPTLRAMGANPKVDGVPENVRIQYQVFDSKKVRIHTGWSVWGAGGGAWVTPTLKDGNYTWQARVQNKSELWSEKSTAIQSFTVDTVAPNAPFVISPHFPEKQVGGAFSDRGKFLLRPRVTTGKTENVSGYLFSLDGNLANVVYAANKGTQWTPNTALKAGTIYFAKADNGAGNGTVIVNGSASPVFAPAKPGAHTLYVKAVDQAGSTSPQTSYRFDAGITSPHYTYGETMINGGTVKNTDGTTTTLAAGTTTSTTGKLLAQTLASGVFASGYQAMLANISSTSKVAVGDSVTFSFNVPKTGMWTIGANLTTAADYGTYTLTLDKGQPTEVVLVDGFDAYTPGVTTTYRNFGTVKSADGPMTLGQGAHTVTLTVTGKNASSNGHQVGIDLLRLAPTPTCAINDTAGCLNNVAISTYTAGATPAVTPADADGSGYSFEAADFKSAGWNPGSTVTVNGAAITLPAAFGNGTPDNMLASGQYITVPKTGVINKGNALVFVGFSTAGASIEATGTITYAPGSCGSTARTTEGYTVDAVNDWSYTPDSDALLTFNRRNRNSGVQLAANVRTFAVSVPLKCPGATVEAVILPVTSTVPQSGVPALHFLGLGIRPTSDNYAHQWVGSWATAQDTAAVQSQQNATTVANSSLNNQTVRIPALLSIGTGGETEQVRVRLANSMGKTPVTFDAVSIAQQDPASGGPAAASVPVPVTFAGTGTVTLAAGTDVVSDPISLSLSQRTTALVSLKVRGNVATLSGHHQGRTPVYTTAPDGIDRSGEQAGTNFTRSTMLGIPFLSGIDVSASAEKPVGAVALFGDQTVNADTATDDGRSQLPAQLATAFAAAEEGNNRVPFGLLNLGTSSVDNRSLLPASSLRLSTNAKTQVDRAVLNQSNVRTVLISSGAADLLTCTAATADACATPVQDKLVALTSQLHQYQTDDKGGTLKVYVATIPPFAGPRTAVQEQARQIVNTFILDNNLQGHADRTIDFAAAVSTDNDATSATVHQDYLASNGTAQHPNDLYYEQLAQQYLADSDQSEWHVDDPTGTENDAASIADWNFYDGTGTTAKDTGSGTGGDGSLHHATLTGVKWGSGRLVGKTAGSFDGTSSFARTDLKLNTTRSFTVSAWVRLTDKSTDRTVFARGAGQYGSLYLQYEAASDRWVARIPSTTTAAPDTWARVESAATARTGLWTHLAVSHHSDDETVSLFVNGVMDDSREGVKPFNDDAGPTWIGRSGEDRFSGDINNVRVWARHMEAAEAEGLAAAVPMVNWQLDYNGPPTEAEDSSEANNPGQLTGGARYVTPGHADWDFAAVHLDGVDGAVTRDAVLRTDQSFSVTAWARLEKTDADFTVVGQDGEHTGGFALQWGAVCGCWRFVLTHSDVAAPSTSAAESPTGDFVGVWTHLGGVYDAATGTVSIYVNGELAGTSPVAEFPSWNSTGVFAVGRTIRNAWFPGDIDNVRVWQGAISADDVMTESTR